MKIKLTLLLLLFSAISFAQKVKVIDRHDLQGVTNVLIYNQNNTATSLTDDYGYADLSPFKKSDHLTFQHPSFVSLQISMAQLEAANFVVQLNERTINLSQVTVSANKWEQKRTEVPNKIVSINARQVAFSNPQTAADLLDETGEVFIQKSQMGGGSPMIRGFAANRVLLVVDGVRMNNAIYRSGNLQNVISLDANSLESAEVIFGPGSIIYGSDALGGVMDFHTPKPALSFDENRWSGGAMIRYATANNEKTGHLHFNYGSRKFAAYTGFTWNDFEDLRMGSIGHDSYALQQYVETHNGIDKVLDNNDLNKQIGSAYNQMNLLQKFRYRPNDNYEINYAFHFSNTSDVPRYDRLIQTKNEQPKYAEWYYGPQKWMMHRLALQLNRPKRFYNTAKITASYQQIEESRNDRKLNNSNLRSRTEEVDVYALNLDLDKKLGQNTNLFYGLDMIYNRVESEGFSEDIVSREKSIVASRYPDGGTDYTTAAAYAQIKNNLKAKWTLLGGVRYSIVSLTSKLIDNTFYQFPFSEIKLNTAALNGSLGIVFRPNDQWQINGNIASGFRAPNLDDIGKVFDSEPGNVIVPNADLKPEYAYNFELGISKNFGERDIRADLALFYTLLDQAMVRRDFTFNGNDSIIYDGEMSNVQALVNTGSASLYGASATINAHLFGDFSFRSSLSYTKGEDDENLPLRHVSPLFGKSALIFKKNKFRSELYVEYNGEITHEDLAPGEKNKTYMYATNADGKPYAPAWVTLNARASYQITNCLQANAGIENILDARYRPYSSGIAAAGRNLFITLRASF